MYTTSRTTRFSLALTLSGALLSSGAFASTTATTTPPVPAGCAAYNPHALHTFYVDPVHGSMDGDGSQAHPWHTVAEMVSKGVINGEDASMGVVHAGDSINLMSGNQGTLTLSNYNGKFNNRDFITIQAAPGQQPVFTGIKLQGVSQWAFQGLTIQNPETVPEYFVLASLNQVNNIVFTGNTIYSQGDVTRWTPQQWMVSAAHNGIRYNGTCGTVHGNMVKNVRYGINIVGDRIRLTNNAIDYFADDAIDFNSSNTLLSGNIVTNHYGQLSDGNHNDGMQGWVPAGVDSLSNVTIDSNVVLASTGAYPAIPALPTGVGQDYLQGISIFDGKWNNVTMTNNVVATAAYHGISLAAEVSNALIANNTVLLQTSDPKFSSWICVAASKTNVNPVNVVVRNNIANTFSLVTDGVTQDHNISLTTDKLWNWKAPLNGALLKADPTKLFVKYNPDHASYNLNLTSGSPAIGEGVAEQAPAMDILGHARIPSAVDAGAYAFVKAPPVVAYSGTVTILANARQQGTPKLIVAVDDAVIGTATVTADSHTGQSGEYSFTFTSPTQPKKLTLTLDGYSAQVQPYVSLSVFNVKYGSGKLDLLRTMDVSKVVAGNATMSRSADIFETNGSEIAFDVSKQL